MHFSVLTHLDFPSEHKENMTQSRFESAMTVEIEDRMAPFDENTENPDYLEFQDMDDEVRKDYQEKTLTAVRLPNGSIIPTFWSQFSRHYCVENGLVFQKNWGRLRHSKRTKKARRMCVLPDYPVSKLCKRLDEFAQNFYGYTFDAEYLAYGYRYNPDSFYDWFQVGGRWPLRFLIPDNDPFYILGEKSWASEKGEKKAPDGYRWVTGARKSSIQWELMKLLAVDAATAMFHELEQWYLTGVAPDDEQFWGHVTDKGIEYFGELIYEKGLTLEQYLKDRNLTPEQRLIPSAYYILDDGSVECCDQHSDNGEDGDSWDQYVADYLDSLPNDAVIVTLDCHD